jgi:hypothetical protein
MCVCKCNDPWRTLLPLQTLFGRCIQGAARASAEWHCASTPVHRRRLLPLLETRAVHATKLFSACSPALTAACMQRDIQCCVGGIRQIVDSGCMAVHTSSLGKVCRFKSSVWRLQVTASLAARGTYATAWSLAQEAIRRASPLLCTFLAGHKVCLSLRSRHKKHLLGKGSSSLTSL